MRFSFTSAALLSLAACSSGSSGENQTTEPANVVVTAVSTTEGIFVTGARYDEASDDLIVQDDEGNEFVLSGGVGGTSTYFSAEDSDGYRRISESGKSEALLYASEGYFLGYTLSRVEDTTLPTTGAAAYTGTYVGILTNSGDTDFNYQVNGQATLNVDFAAQDGVTGEITDRVVSRTGSGVTFTASDVTFLPTDLGADGGFSGTTDTATLQQIMTTPGGAERVTDYSGAGTFEGFVSGAQAGEAVGAVTIDYTGKNAIAQTETGIFVLEAVENE